MKQIITSLVFCFGITAFSFAQDKLNQLDSVEKKDGKWIVYLDYSWKEVKDSSNAVYYRYAYYDHGLNLYHIGGRGPKKYKHEPINDTVGRKGKLILLNGEYKSYDKKGRLVYVNTFTNGDYVLYKEYDKSGNLRMKMDFSPKFDDLPHSCYYIYVYKKDGYVECYKGKGKMAYGILADSTIRDTLKIIGDSTFATITFYLNGKLVGKQDKISVKKLGQKGPAHFDIKHGHSTTWYYNGQKRSDGEYYYGKKIGEWHYWDRDGKEQKGVEKD